MNGSIFFLFLLFGIVSLAVLQRREQKHKMGDRSKAGMGPVVFVFALCGVIVLAVGALRASFQSDVIFFGAIALGSVQGLFLGLGSRRIGS